MLPYLIYIGIGIFAGFFSGLIGISGGVLTVPLLVVTFGMINFPSDYVMHVAIGTSLAAMISNTLSSMIAHNKKSGILWHMILKLLPGVVIGAITGALTAHLLPDNVLEVIFAVFLLLLAIYFSMKKEPAVGDHKIPKAFGLSACGLVIGYISNVLGIGGGIFCIPLFTYFRLSFVRAIGSSVAVGFFISTLGALSYLYFGQKAHIDFPWTYGYLYLPAFLIISCVSWFFAPLGAKAAHIYPQNKLRRIFAIVLLIMSIIVFFS